MHATTDERLSRLRRRWAVTGLLLLGAALPGTVATSAHAGRSDVVSLAGKSVISGRRGATVVQVPKRVALSAALQENADVSAEGKGPVVGVALIPKQGGGDPLFVATVSNDALCPSGDCPQGGPVTFVRGDVEPKTQRAFVEPGLYTLYLIGGKGRLEVSLRLNGLGGTAHISPAMNAPMKLETVDPESVTPGSQSLSSWYGEPFDLKDGGQVFSTLWLKTTAHVNSETDFCLYPDHDPSSEPHTFGCPFAFADFHYSHGIASVAPVWNVIDWTVWDVEGPMAQGWAYESVGVVDDAGGVALWLPYI